MRGVIPVFVVPLEVMSSHELVSLSPGRYSVKPLAATEAMHSSIGAWEEAQLVYVGQSGLPQCLSELGPELALYDVGMGIAANALSAIECFVESRPARDLRIVSFEKHRDALELALRHSELFPWIARNRAAVADLLSHGRWSLSRGAAQVSWELREGDFLEQDLSKLPRPELVYFDFYSPAETPELWEARCFAKLYERAQPGTRLLTYCSSTAARAAMLLGGFAVGAGVGTEAKRETTIAAMRLADLDRPLGPDWLDKLGRSAKPMPGDWSDRAHDGIAALRSHFQFSQ